MSTLTIRKKSLKTWLHIDSVIGDFIISKFYFNADNISFQIVEQGNAKRVIYNISDITLYDDVNGGGAETFSTITQLSLRLEALNYPAFQYDGQIVSIANLITAGSGVTITGSGTLLSPYVINSTGGGGGGAVNSVTGDTVDNTDPANPIVNVPTLQEVADQERGTTLAGGDFSVSITESGVGNVNQNLETSLGFPDYWIGVEQDSSVPLYKRIFFGLFADSTENTIFSFLSGATNFMNIKHTWATARVNIFFPNKTVDGDYTLATLDDITANGLPSGGTAGQILTKVDATDYNATWQENYADWTSVVKHTVKNDGTGLITKGTAVYVTGSNGTNMLVGKASNTSEATSSKTMGLMQSDITTTGVTQTGFVITEGLLSGLNTAGTTAGDPVWLGLNGALIYGLASKPYAPAHLVFIGIVTKVSSGSGEIFIKPQNGFELKEIHDVDLISNAPTNNQGLIFETSSGLWKNKTIDKTLVGLANVDNTSDANKPISSATQNALDGKQQDLFNFIDSGIIVYDDYIATSYVSGSSNWNQSSGSNSTGNSLTGAQGTQICTTGIVITGGGGTTLGDVNAGNFFIGNGAWSYKRRVYIPILSTATERYVIFDGLQAGSSFINATNMVGFIYDEGGTYATGVSAGSANWKCFTINGGTRTITTTSTAVASATWTKLRIEINAAGTSVAFYVNDILVATHTTNIPASTTALHQGNFIVKSAGTTARTYVSDYMSLKQTLTTSR